MVGKVWCLVAGLLLMPASVGFAQDGGVAGELQRSAETSPEEKKQYVSDALSEMTEGIKQVEKLVDSANKKNDESERICDNRAAIHAISRSSFFLFAESTNFSTCLIPSVISDRASETYCFFSSGEVSAERCNSPATPPSWAKPTEAGMRSRPATRHHTFPTMIPPVFNP
jgi:hypothetical protein